MRVSQSSTMHGEGMRERHRRPALQEFALKPLSYASGLCLEACDKSQSRTAMVSAFIGRGKGEQFATRARLTNENLLTFLETNRCYLLAIQDEL